MAGLKEIEEKVGSIVKKAEKENWFHVVEKKEPKKVKDILLAVQHFLCVLEVKEKRKVRRELLGKRINNPMPYKSKKVKSGIITNESLSFKDYLFLIEALEIGDDEKGRGYLKIKAPEGHDVFSIKTMVEVFKDIKNNKEEIVNYIKNKIKPHHFSPLIVIISMMLAGINTQLFINKNPEVLNVGPKIVQKAAEFLDKNPKLLKIFQ